MRRVKRLWFTTAAIFISTCGILLVLAASDFILFWWDTCYGDNETVLNVRRRSQGGPGIHEETPDGSIRVRRFLNRQPRHDQISDRHIPISTNALGHRDSPIGPKPDDEYRILVLGDSCTFAGYVEVTETYPFYVERMLNEAISANRHVRAINAGVTGIDLKDELNILLETGLLVQPDMVLIGTSQNDSSASIFFPEREGVLSRSQLANKWHDLHFYGGLEKKTKALYTQWTGEDYPTKTYPSGAWRTNQEAFELEIAHNVVGWGAAWFPYAWEEMRGDYETIWKLAQQYKFETVVMLFPIAVQVEAEHIHDKPQQMFRDVMNEVGLKHYDPLLVLRNAHNERGGTLFYDHAHLIPEGNRIISRALVEFLLTETALGDL